MLWWVAETTLVASALAAVAGLAPRLRPLGPAARHALWLLVLLKLMVPPVVRAPWPAFRLPARVGVTATANVETAPVEFVFDGETLRRLGEPDAPVVEPAPAPRAVSFDPALLARLALIGWAAGSILVAATQVVRIARFRRRVAGAAPAPGWVVEELDRLAGRIGVEAPEAREVPGLSGPLLWCLGRPKLLLPSGLVDTLGAGRWRGVLAHELAHLRRGDPWVSRLALVAGWVWWWNPVYRLARVRVDAEAELACDAWVVSTLPEDRLVYAETLFDLGCASSADKSPPDRTPSPALGVTGAGRFFERRLAMILNDQVPCRPSWPALAGAGLLGLFALPSWTAAGPPAVDDRKPVVVVDAGNDKFVVLDDDDKPAKPAETKKRIRIITKVDKDDKGGDAKSEKDQEIVIDLDLKDLGNLDVKLKEMLGKLGPEVEGALKGDGSFEEKMEALGEKLGKELEAKFGPGSDFEKSMEKLGESLGDGSDFVEKMAALGSKLAAELGEKLGPGSEFNDALQKGIEEETAKAKAKAKDKDKDDDGDDDEAKAKAKLKSLKDQAARTAEMKVRMEAAKARMEAAKARTAERAKALEARTAERAKAAKQAAERAATARTLRKPTDGKTSRDKRIQSLESKLDELMKELKKLKDEGDADEDDEAAGEAKTQPQPGKRLVFRTPGGLTQFDVHRPQAGKPLELRRPGGLTQFDVHRPETLKLVPLFNHNIGAEY